MNCIVHGVAKLDTTEFHIYIYTDGSHILFSVSLFLLTDVHTQLLTGSFQLMIHNHIQLKVLNYIYQQHPSPTFSLLCHLTQRTMLLLSNHLSPKFSYCFHLLHSLWYSAGSQVHKFNLISIAQIHSFILSTPATLLLQDRLLSILLQTVVTVLNYFSLPVFPETRMSIYTTVKVYLSTRGIFQLLPTQSEPHARYIAPASVPMAHS